MVNPTDLKRGPVSPAVIEVPDLTAACAALGLPAPTPGAESMEMEILPGCTLTVRQTPGTPTPFAYLCVANLTEARRHLESMIGTVAPGPDSIDPDSMRLRGCLLHGGGMVIDAVQCPRARDEGRVPCDEDCAPSRSFI
jgi:hypothetical protein